MPSGRHPPPQPILAARTGPPRRPRVPVVLIDYDAESKHRRQIVDSTRRTTTVETHTCTAVDNAGATLAAQGQHYPEKSDVACTSETVAATNVAPHLPCTRSQDMAASPAAVGQPERSTRDNADVARDPAYTGCTTPRGRPTVDAQVGLQYPRPTTAGEPQHHQRAQSSPRSPSRSPATSAYGSDANSAEYQSTKLDSPCANTSSPLTSASSNPARRPTRRLRPGPETAANHLEPPL